MVAGGAGFIGSHLSSSLLEDGHEVLCLDNLLTGNKDNVEELQKNNRFLFVEHDVTRPLGPVLDKFAPFHAIFHLASPASPNKKSPRSYIAYPIETLQANSQGTYNLLELALKTGALFLFASSSEVYGDPTVSPQNEEYFGNVNPNGIRSVYDEGKRFGEAITMAYVRKHKVNARIVRIFNTYGPKMQKDDGRVVSNFINQALEDKPITVYGKGTQTRSFCYISDMVEGLEKAMFDQGTAGEVVNLGNPNERTIAELATMVKEMTKSSSEITFEDLPEDDPKTRRPDIEKAKRILGWTPSVGIEEGLRKTIEYFKTV